MFVIQGCVYVPPIWDATDEIYHADKIKEGQTTRTQVLNMLGPPQGRSEDDKRYVYTGEKSKGFLVLLGQGGDIGLLLEEKWSVHIEFDDNDLVAAVQTGRDPKAPFLGLGQTVKAQYDELGHITSFDTTGSYFDQEPVKQQPSKYVSPGADRVPTPDFNQIKVCKTTRAEALGFLGAPQIASSDQGRFLYDGHYIAESWYGFIAKKEDWWAQIEFDKSGVAILVITLFEKLEWRSCE